MSRSCNLYGLSVSLRTTLQEVASKLISASVGKDENGDPINPMDAHFRSLRLSSMEPVTPKTKEYSALETYVRDTHGSTHHVKVQIMNAFRVERCVYFIDPTSPNGKYLLLPVQTRRNRCLDEGRARLPGRR